MPNRAALLIVVLALVAAACQSSAEPTTTTTTATTTTVAPTTTEATTTTAAPAPTTLATTTTTEPLRVVTATGDLPQPLLDEVAALYSFVADARNDASGLPPGMVDHLGERSAAVADSVEAEGVWVTLPEGDAVAVVHVADDTLLAVGEEATWRIVGGQVGDAPPWLGSAPRTLLVLGSDARVGQNQLRFRADSIHIVTTVPEATVGAIVGFPRDSWVEGPDGGIKFTHLMAGRGPEIMLETTRDLTGLPIEGYVVTGFKGFTGLMNILGSLVIDLPTTMRTGNNWKNFAAGLQTLSPLRALQLARIRKGLPGGDFARSRNQGLIMQAAMTMLKDMGIDMLPVMLVGLLENAWTDLSTEELLTWAATIYFMEPTDLTNTVLPGKVGSAGGASVVFLSEDVEDIFRDLEDGILDELEE